MPHARSHPTRILAATLGLTLALALCLLALPDTADAALQKIAGYEQPQDNRFGGLYSYLANLRDAIVPLAIPVGSIGLVVGGGMYVFGNPHAGRILFGVAAGLGLIELGDGRLIGFPDTDFDEPVVHDQAELKVMRELAPGDEFSYVFDLGDHWRHRCRVAPDKVDPVATAGCWPERPVPVWGWGWIPNQYGRVAEDGGDEGSEPE